MPLTCNLIAVGRRIDVGVIERGVASDARVELVDLRHAELGVEVEEQLARRDGQVGMGVPMEQLLKVSVVHHIHGIVTVGRLVKDDKS